MSVNKPSSQLLDSFDMPSLDPRRGTVCVDIGWLANDDHRTAFRAIFERVLEANRALLEPMDVIAVAAIRPLRTEDSALSELPANMRDVVADAARVADALYDSHNTQVELALQTASDSARLQIAFDNPEFRILRHAIAA